MSKYIYRWETDPAAIELDDIANDLRKLTAGDYQRVRKCAISDHTISIVPVEIARFENLEELWVGGWRIETLPPEIAQCRKLRKITVFSGNLFSYLWALNVGDKDRPKQWFNRLPAEIGELQSLQELQLNMTQISTLPPEIAKLKNLRSLHINDCEFTTLPKEIGRLANLEELLLPRNPLKKLPDEMVQLRQLCKLDLRETQLSGLPEAIGGLASLQELELTNTPLEKLPDEMAQLTQLWKLDLRESLKFAA